MRESPPSADPCVAALDLTGPAMFPGGAATWSANPFAVSARLLPGSPRPARVIGPGRP